MTRKSVVYVIWDVNHECRFVCDRIENNKILGSPLQQESECFYEKKKKKVMFGHEKSSLWSCSTISLDVPNYAKYQWKS